jgi:hypothetical protein
MTAGDFWSEHSTNLKDGQEWHVAPSGAVELHMLANEKQCDVYFEVDTTDDGSFDLSVKIEDDLEGEEFSQTNKIEITDETRQRLRVVQTEQGDGDHLATGVEVIPESCGGLWQDYVKDLGQDETWIVEPDTGEAIEVHSIVAGGDFELFIEQDTNGDGTYDLSIKIDKMLAGQISQQNQIELSSSRNQRLKLKQTSSGSSSYVVTGRVIPD